MQKIKAVLFDMDGVLVNSEPVITEAAIRALNEWNINAKPEDFHEFTGMGEDRFIGGVAEKYGVLYTLDMKRRTYEIYLTIVNDKIGRYPAAVPTLQALHNAGLRLVLASAADRIKVDANLCAAGIDSSLFYAIISGDDVTNKKPAPDVYLLAAEKAGCPPECCIVVEDALSGLAAAHAAGMKCICVTTSFSDDIFRENNADYICSDVGDIIKMIEITA